MDCLDVPWSAGSLARMTDGGVPSHHIRSIFDRYGEAHVLHWGTWAYLYVPLW